MNVERTEIWILALCRSFGWGEAQLYAAGFKRNGYDGQTLRHLHDYHLRMCKVNNPNHRRTILSYLGQIFLPSTYISLVPVQWSAGQIDTSTGTSQWNVETSSDESLPFIVTEKGNLPSCMSISEDTSICMKNVESEYKTSDVSEVNAKASSLRGRSLELTLQLDDLQAVEELLKDFDSTFENYNYDKRWEKSSVDKTAAIFLVRFESIMMAQNALVLASKNGYRTSRSKSPQNTSERSTPIGAESPQHALLPRKFKRPSPKNVCRFIVLSEELTVRKGKTLNSEKIGKKLENDEVYVNRIKGRRARLVDTQNWNTWGWASLFSVKGIPLMEQVE